MDPFKDTEIEYVRCFSRELKEECFNRFWDTKAEDIYANNITIIKDKLSSKELIKIITKEIDYRKKLGKEFCIVEIYTEEIDEILKGITRKVSSVDKFDYMAVDTVKYKELKTIDDFSINQVKTEDDFKMAEKINVLDNIPIMGKAYSTYRIKRKIDAYRDLSNGLKIFLCYKGKRPIGSLELLMNNQIAKIEDFGIIKKYRGQGYGTCAVRNILKEAYYNNIKYAYVITDSKDTAKHMYSKCGFIKIGEKTQLIFDL